MIDFLSAGGAPGNLHYAALDQTVHSMQFDKKGNKETSWGVSSIGDFP
jgi:hypothetical protein